MSLLRVGVLAAAGVIAIRVVYPEFFSVPLREDRARDEQGTREEDEVNDGEAAIEPEPEGDATGKQDPFARFDSPPSDTEQMARDRAVVPSKPVEGEEDSAAGEDENALTLDDIEDPEIDLYFAGWCSHSREALAFLDQNGFNYTLHDVDADATARQEAIDLSDDGRLALPVLLIGETVMTGFSPGGFQRSLQKEKLRILAEENRR